MILHMYDFFLLLNSVKNPYMSLSYAVMSKLKPEQDVQFKKVVNFSRNLSSLGIMYFHRRM